MNQKMFCERASLERVAQVLEYLPSKHEALSSNPSTAPSPTKKSSVIFIFVAQKDSINERQDCVEIKMMIE
jgi:hypothetical protein